jgi:hypothetical protein
MTKEFESMYGDINPTEALDIAKSVDEGIQHGNGG